MVRLNEVRFLQIEQQPFVPCRDDFVAPAMYFGFVANFSSKERKRVAMVPKPGDDLGNRVAAGEQNREDERDDEIGTQRRVLSVQGATAWAAVDFKRGGWEAVTP